ncbi:uncharacterized protein LOC123702963 [Colias croceus]|uniref:uncharacterized protein LOC123702963 n=1 Tax=Colias crocea TaxID=72248 RepID=UPI001E27B56C|nr:uncharacterized protein LOC123702963 [Colias croceus]
MAAGRWDSETTMKFIKELKSYECLWNPKTVLYKNKLARHAAYQKIVKKINISGFGVPEAIKKMQSLRSTYYQEKTKIQNSMRSGLGRDAIYIPNMNWYKEMDSLLSDINESRISLENDKDDKESTSSEQDNIVPSSLEIQYISIPKKEPSESTQPPVTNESRQKKFHSSGEHKYLQEAVNRDLPIEDRFDIFAKSVAVQLRELSLERSMVAQTRIQNILSELAIENYNMSASNETDNLII